MNVVLESFRRMWRPFRVLCMALLSGCNADDAEPVSDISSTAPVDKTANDSQPASPTIQPAAFAQAERCEKSF